MKKIFLTALLMFTLIIPSVQANNTKYATVFHPDTGQRKVVTVGDPHAFDGGFLLETSHNYFLDTSDQLGFSVVSNYKTTLSRSISSTASTIFVSSLSTKDSHTLTMNDLGSKVFLTLEPGSNKEEIVMCTGIGTLSWTTCTRGLAFYATSTAAVTANQNSHSAGATIIMSNVHYVYDELVDKDATETIDGQKTFTATTTFSALPNTTTSYTPAADGDLATKKYVDDTITSGAPNATESVKGLIELATPTEVASSTPTGSTGASLVPQAKYATSTPGNNIGAGYTCVTENDGNLSADCLPLTEELTLSSSTVNTLSTSKFYLDGVDSDNLTGGNNADSLHLHEYNYVLFASSTTNKITLGGTQSLFATTTIPANVMGTNNIIRFKTCISNMELVNSSSFTFYVKYGSQKSGDLAFSNATGVTGNFQGCISGELLATGATNTQKASFLVNVGRGEMVDATADVFEATNYANGNFTVDSTAAQDFVVTVLNPASSSLWTESTYVEILQQR